MEKVIAKREKSETGCGCEILTFADGTKTREPCPTHKPVMELFDRLAAQGQQIGILNAVADVYGQLIVCYRILWAGCKEHWNYRGTRKPFKNCRICRRIWTTRLYLDDLTTKGIPILQVGKNLKDPVLGRAHPKVQPVPSDAKALAEEGEQDIKDAIQAGEGEPFVGSGVEQTADDMTGVSDAATEGE